MTTSIAPRGVEDETQDRTSTASHPASRSGAGGELTDQDIFRIFVRGALLGTPTTLAVLVLVAVVALPDPRGAILASIWPALWGGWFFGGNVALAFEELRSHHR